MTNDSVIFWGGTDDENMKIISLLYIIYILYIIMNLEQSFAESVWGEMTIVICHNCHFLVEMMSGHPCGHLAGAQGDFSPVRL